MAWGSLGHTQVRKPALPPQTKRLGYALTVLQSLLEKALGRNVVGGGGKWPALPQMLPRSRSRSKQVLQIGRLDPTQVRSGDSAGSGTLPPFALWNQGHLDRSPTQVVGGGEQANHHMRCSSLEGQVCALGRPYRSTPHDIFQAALCFSLPTDSLHFPDLNVHFVCPELYTSPQKVCGLAIPGSPFPVWIPKKGNWIY